VYHVQTAADLRSIWFEATDTVGITAGTSTPDSVIEEVERWLEDFAQFQTHLTQHAEEPCHATMH